MVVGASSRNRVRVPLPWVPGMGMVSQYICTQDLDHTGVECVGDSGGGLLQEQGSPVWVWYHSIYVPRTSTTLGSKV